MTTTDPVYDFRSDNVGGVAPELLEAIDGREPGHRRALR